MNALILNSLQVVVELLVPDEVPAIFTFLIVWVGALFYVAKGLLCYYWGKHRRHFMWGGCLQARTSNFFYWTVWFWICLFLL